ncbi:MAG: hypothetical protein IJ298_09620 [Ruminococcus sp.]|nr:hypothetical protein [Ruminococcus sp.]
MYNEELKTKFVRGYTNSISTAEVCQTIFNAFEQYEVEWDADLCTRSAEELQPVVDNLVGFRARSKWMRLIILKDYVKWCIGMKVPGACDGMLKIETVGLEKVKHQTVASPLHLQRYLDSICEPESEETTDNIYRCFYWLAYGGVAEEDILSIKCSDVDLNNMVVRYNGTEVPIYREALPAFKNCVKLTQFVYKHPNYDKLVYKDRADGDTLVRGIRSAPSIKAMRVELSRRSKAKMDEGKTDLKLSYFRVWISGLFYRMYERERAGMPVDFSAAAAQFMEGKTYKLDRGRNTPEAKKRQLTRDYLEDYERWKLAFAI